MLLSICVVFHFRKVFDFRPIRSDRVVLSTKDMIAKQQMLNREVIFKRGTIIRFAPWSEKVHTEDNAWFVREDIWVNVIGLPHYLWSLENAVTKEMSLWKQRKSVWTLTG